MTDTPKLWRDMTPEEKGALLLAHHEGKVIEGRCGTWEQGEWMVVPEPAWMQSSAYRVKPEPKRETVHIYGSPGKHVQWVLYEFPLDTHLITFDLIDGEPDCASIRMERIK